MHAPNARELKIILFEEPITVTRQYCIVIVFFPSSFFLILSFVPLTFRQWCPVPVSKLSLLWSSSRSLPRWSRGLLCHPSVSLHGVNVSPGIHWSCDWQKEFIIINIQPLVCVLLHFAGILSLKPTGYYLNLSEFIPNSHIIYIVEICGNIVETAITL